MKSVFFILPYEMSVRTFLQDGFCSKIDMDEDVRVFLISRTENDKDKFVNLSSQMNWVSVIRPFKDKKSLFSDFMFSCGYFIHISLVYRFNAIAGFNGFCDRLKQSRYLRKVAAKEGLPTLKRFGFPFPRSRKLYKILSKIYWAFFTRHRKVVKLFDEAKPEKIILFHCQNHFVSPYVYEANKRNIPILGVNGSWDQPTTKGPLIPNIQQMAAQNSVVKDDLVKFHHMDPNRITLLGWPQMDLYSTAELLEPRETFLKRIDVTPEQKYILIGAYSERLGSHEPKMALELAEAAKRGDFGDNVMIYLRPHPLEAQWQERFGELIEHSHCIVEEVQLGNLPHLMNLIHYSSAVIASAGTINLDAVALKKPSIAVAFEDESLDYYDRPSRRYNMEHFQQVLSTGGLELVKSQEELHLAVKSFLQDPMLNMEKQDLLRDKILAPLDGHASARLAKFVSNGMETSL